jgi:hypothetical protein
VFPWPFYTGESDVDDTRPNLPPDPGADPLLRHARRLLDETPGILLDAETARDLVRESLARLRECRGLPTDRRG